MRQLVDLYRDGADVLGLANEAGVDWGDPRAVDDLVAKFRADLDRVPVMTYSVAEAVARRALEFTRETERIARAQGSKTLIGPAMWKSPRGHLDWHAAALKREVGARDPRSTPYERADDLKKWAAGAYRSLMAATQERDLRERFSREFWSDVADAVSRIPEKLRPKNLVEWLTGIPLWAWVASGAVAVGAVGFGVYKIALAAAPAAGAAVVGRYLPARRG